MAKIAIIGAGFGGMAAAWDLRRAGHEVTIYEAADYVGGLASGFKEPGWDWSVEKFYHHWFASDKHMLGLIKELGWEDKVLFPRPLTVMYHKGKFYPFDSIIKALLFPGLGFGINKIRFGLVGLYLRLTNNWKPLGAHHRGRLDAQMGRGKSLQADVGAAGNRQVRRTLLQAGEHGLDVGPPEGPHHPPGHVRGRVPEFREYVRGETAGDGCGDPAPDAGHAD